MVIKIHMSLESHSTVESLHSYCPSSVSDSGSVQRSPLSTLYPSGLVLAEKRQRLTTTCRLDLYMFPFDKQICNITFSSVNYNGRFHQISLLKCCDPVIYFSSFSYVVCLCRTRTETWNMEGRSFSYLSLWKVNDHRGRVATRQHEHFGVICWKW